jgi:hypothetical protein
MALTSLDAVKEFLEKQGSEETGEPSDDLLENLVQAASTHITNFSKREFEPSNKEERTFAHDGQGRSIFLSPFDLRSVDSIKVESESGSSELTPDEYKLRPKPSKDGVYEWIRLAVDPGESEIAIKGDWGFAEVPADVEHWAKLTVVSWLRGDVFAYVPDLEAPAPLMKRALPREVAMGLEDTYRRVSVG